MTVNQKSQNLQGSATMAMAAKAAERKKSGLPVYNLSVGEPDFETPAHVKEAAVTAIREGFTRYTNAGGIQELKEAVLQRCQLDKGLHYELKELTCTNGGKEALFNFFQVFLEPGDEVLVQDPAWVSYETQIEWAGGVCVRVNTPAKDGFRLTAEKIRSKLTPRSRVLVLNSPSNPTGSIIPKEELKKIAELCKEKNLFVLTDEVYEHFNYGGDKPLSILQIAPELKDQALLVNSMSKTYAMTGWRLGYALGPSDIIAKMQALQSQSATNPCSVSQKAAIAALTGPQDSIELMRSAFEKRRSLLLEGFHGSKIEVVEPDGAFYMMLNLNCFLLPGETDTELCLRILENTGVALVPGSPFGQEAYGWARLSFASSEETLKKALDGLLALKV